MRVMVNLKCTINNMKRHFMRSQVKSVDGFAANPIRARLMISELERLVLEESPAKGRFERYEHLSKYIAASKNNSDFVLPRRSFFKWKKGEALPNSSARSNLDKLFPRERVGSGYGDRHCQSVEQTLMCAMDLISEKETSDKSSRYEALEILANIQGSWKNKIKNIVNLGEPKITDYNRMKKPKYSSVRDTADIRLPNLPKKRVLLARHDTDAVFSTYDPTSYFDVLYLFLLNSKKKVKLDAEVRYYLCLDLISSAIACYVLMLYQNIDELYSGGKMVERYRMVYNYITGNKGSNYAYNYHRESGADSELAGHIREVFHCFSAKVGLSSEELLGVTLPVDPNNPKSVEKWFLG